VTELAGIETTGTTGPGVDYQGVIALEWPEPRPGYECAPMPGWKIAVFDALNGRQITTVTRLVIHASASDVVTADVTMYADLDGQPVFDGKPYYRGQAGLGGEVIYGTFPFLIAEMRVRPHEPDRAALAPRFQEAGPG
jgi:hypothetical protein